MNIFSEAPVDWRDLQNKVGKIFADMNYEVGIEKDIETVRGNINIDVCAIDVSKFPKLMCLCECKYWSNPVPKSVVHSFRSVIGDVGAQCGYIISKEGFQSGAYLSAEMSNVELMTWEEFLEVVKEQWLECMFTKLYTIGKPLRHYTNYLKIQFSDRAEAMGEDVLNRYYRLSRKYDKIRSFIMPEFGVLAQEDIIDFRKHKVERAMMEIGELKNITSYVQYFDFMIEYCRKGIEEFDTLFEEKIRLE